MPTATRTIFVSYAHKDGKWLAALTTLMAPWLRERRLNLWDDTRIAAGQRWKAEIEAAMDEASVAVLLVTKEFLASRFVVENELPVLLDKARADRLRLIWVPIGHSGVEATELAAFEAAHDPARPLTTLRGSQRDKALLAVVRQIVDAATLKTLAGGLQIIDETTEPLEAALDRRPVRPDRSFRVQAHYDGQANRIAFTGAQTIITTDDLALLPEADRQFIADLEDSLRRNYRRWVGLRQRADGDGPDSDSDDQVQAQLERIARLMCRDLKLILDFLRSMHKVELEDHYSRYRFLCDRLGSA
jgi:hypothetical protein